MTAILCVKSPCRTRSVPVNSSCTEPVIDLRQREPVDQRDDLDDQEQRADDEQHEQQALAEACVPTLPCAAEMRS